MTARRLCCSAASCAWTAELSSISMVTTRHRHQQRRVGLQHDVQQRRRRGPPLQVVDQHSERSLRPQGAPARCAPRPYKLSRPPRTRPQCLPESLGRARPRAPASFRRQQAAQGVAPAASARLCSTSNARPRRHRPPAAPGCAASPSSRRVVPMSGPTVNSSHGGDPTPRAPADPGGRAARTPDSGRSVRRRPCRVLGGADRPRDAAGAIRVSVAALATRADVRAPGAPRVRTRLHRSTTDGTGTGTVSRAP